MEERIRPINNTIEVCACRRDTCMEQLKGQIGANYFKECCEFIERVREYRHKTTIERHLRKYEWLCQHIRGGCSNIGGYSKHLQNHTCIPQQITTPCASTSPLTTSIDQATEITAGTIGETTTTTTTTTVATTSETTEQSNKWMKNLSEVPLTESQMSLLAHGPNFAIAARRPPYVEYITALEQGCLNLEPHSAEELRAEIRGALKHAHNPRRNITTEEAHALAELKKDHSRVILTADKWVALVVMNRADYNNRVQKLLEDRGTYKEIKTDPTNRLKTKLIKLQKVKAEDGISEQLYKKIYPTGAVAPKFYGLPKIHKETFPSDPLCPVGV